MSPTPRPSAWQRIVAASQTRWEARQADEAAGPPPRHNRQPRTRRKRPGNEPVIATPGLVRNGSLAAWRHNRLMRKRAAEARARVEAISRHIDENAPLRHFDQNL